MLGCLIKIVFPVGARDENSLETTPRKDEYYGGSLHGNSESQ